MNITTSTVLSTTICYDCQDRAVISQGLCHTCYERMRKRAIAEGRWESIRVPLDDTLEHISVLQDLGYSKMLIAHLADVEQRTVGRITTGKNEQIEFETRERILSVPAVSLWDLWKTTEYGHRMPSGPAVRRLRAMVTEGWNYKTLGARLGWETTQVARLTLRPSNTVFSGTTREVDAVFRDPEFITPTQTARMVILKHNWPKSLEWDNIDDPDNEIAANNRARMRVKKLRKKIATEKRKSHV